MILSWLGTEGWCRKGRAYGEQGQHERAIECYDQALKLNIDAVAAWYYKGLALNTIQRYR